MRTPIATIALALVLLRASVAAAEPGRPVAVSTPGAGATPPALSIQFSQTPPPVPPAPPERGPHSETAGSEPLLTLEEALTIALAENRGVRAASLEIGRAEDRIGAVQARRLPALRIGLAADYPIVPIDLNFFQGDFGTFPGIGPVPSRDTTLSTQRWLAAASAAVIQPLAQQYRLGLTVDQLRVGQNIAREDLRGQRQTVASDVKRAYYVVLQAQSALDAVQESVRSLRELDRVVEEQLAERKALRADSLDVKTRLAQAEVDAFTAGNALATRKEQLNHLLGREPTTAFRVSPVTETAGLVEVDLDAAQAQALRQRPDLTRADLQVRFADYDVRIKKSEYIPDVDLVLRYLHPATSDRLPQNVALVGVELTWEPWDWGRKRREAAEREKAMEQAKTTAAELRSRIILDVNTRLRKLEETKAQLRVASLGLDAARERLSVTTTRYAEGSALLADVLQSQAAVAAAHDQYQSAALGFWTARAEFERAVGETR
jgi:outer membrane protein TolC